MKQYGVGYDALSSKDKGWNIDVKDASGNASSVTQIFSNALSNVLASKPFVTNGALALVIGVGAIGIYSVMSDDVGDKVGVVEPQPALSPNALMQARRVVENFNSGEGAVDLTTYSHALVAVERDNARKATLQEALKEPCDRGSVRGLYQEPTCFGI